SDRRDCVEVATGSQPSDRSYQARHLVKGYDGIGSWCRHVARLSHELLQPARGDVGLDGSLQCPNQRGDDIGARHLTAAQIRLGLASAREPSGKVLTRDLLQLLERVTT